MPTIDDLKLSRGQRIRYIWYDNLVTVLKGIDTTSVIDYYGYVRKDLIPYIDMAIKLGLPLRRFLEVHSVYERVSGNVGIGVEDPTAALDMNAQLMRLRLSKTPASASDIGNGGDWCWDSDYIYVCISSNTWKRVAISTW